MAPPPPPGARSQPGDAAPLPLARPAATVVIAREASGELEVLLLKRSEVGAFAGMWVFPGGRVDDADAGADEFERAASAAVREAAEEVSLIVDPSDLIALSHWTPPEISPTRFTTWFFVAPWSGGEVRIDDYEIVDARWVPAPVVFDQALPMTLPMAPPTYVTLATLAQAGSFAGLRDLIARRGVERFVTVPADQDGTVVLLWHGDAGYASRDASAAGARHRATMFTDGPLRYERTAG